MDISDFLPIYPEIDQGDIPIYDVPFNQAIYNKKEFYELKLQPTEARPEKGELTRHQKVISRFMSTYTPYDSLLLFHAMGTGKTCSALGAAEQIKSENNGIKKVIVLAKGKPILNNILKELIYVCTNNKYVPNPDPRGYKNEIQILKKQVADFYRFYTFHEFASKIRNLKDSEINKFYSNTMIIIDEVHNLRIKNKKLTGGVDVYAQIHRFLHHITNKKVLLLSGTPMQDLPQEIGSILNLMLPLDKQLPTGKKFIDEFLETPQSGSAYIFKKDKQEEFRSRIIGLVSYLKPMRSAMVEKKFIGDKISDLEMFKIYQDEMSDFQSENYMKVYIEEKGDHSNATKYYSGWFANSRQAASFVFPDGSYGNKGFKKYIDEKIKKTLSKKSKTYALKSDFKNLLTGGNYDEILQNIREYSAKYADAIDCILKNPQKNCWLYSNLVTGSGLIVLSLLLELFGFTKATGTERSGGKRYAILTGDLSPNDINRIIRGFNHPRNAKGEYIQVILGSRVVSEGISLYNVQQVHILTPHWNFSETDQAIARAFRLGSHSALLKTQNRVVVDVYLHAALPTDKKDSIDLKMYTKSEIKDVSIKSIERQLKIAAMDCELFKDRNDHRIFRRVGLSPSSEDFSRECEYAECKYTCDGITKSSSTQNISTYQLYYIQDKIRNVHKHVKELFRTRFIIQLSEITEAFTDYTIFEILTAMSELVKNDTVIYNKYGFKNYIREQHNYFFLVDNISSVPDYLNVFYTRVPNLKLQENFENIVDKQYSKYLQQAISKLKTYSESGDEDAIKRLLIRNFEHPGKAIPEKIQEYLLEQAYLQETATPFGTWVKDYFSNKVITHNSTIISTLGEKNRCLENGVWQDCPDEIDEIVKQKQGDVQTQLENNPFGYYGIIENGRFKIRDVTDKSLLTNIKKNVQTKGQVCQTTKKYKLLTVLLAIANEPVITGNKNIKDMKKEIQTLKNYKDAKSTMESIDGDPTEKDIKILYYYGAMKKPKICKTIQQIFEEKNLLLRE